MPSLDRILALPADEAGRHFVLEALANLREVLDRDVADIDAALGRLRMQLVIHGAVADRALKKKHHRLLRRCRRICDDHELLRGALDLGRRLASRRDFPDARRVFSSVLGPRLGSAGAEVEVEVRRTLMPVVGDMEDAWDGLEIDVAPKGKKRGPRGGELIADWLEAQADEIEDLVADRGTETRKLRRRLARLDDALGPWIGFHPAVETLVGALRDEVRLLREREQIEILRSACADARADAADELAPALRRLGRGQRAPQLPDDLVETLSELAAVLRKGALTRHDHERLFLLRQVPEIDSEVSIEEVYQGWLPGVRVEEAISRIHAGGRPRHARRIGMGQGTRRVEVEEETTEEVFERLWSLTEGCRVRKRRYALQDRRRRVEIEEYHDRELVLARLVGRAREIGAAPPAWLADSILREVTEEGAFRGRRLGI